MVLLTILPTVTFFPEAGQGEQTVVFWRALQLQAWASARVSTADDTLADGPVGLGICMQGPWASGL